MKLLITGASGFLGKKVYSLAKNKGEIIGTCYSGNVPNLLRFDLSNLHEIGKSLDTIRPDVVIHTSAFTDVAGSEENAALAKRINGDATASLAEWCDSRGSKLIYVSSDYVFDGDRGPYSEMDKPYPIQIYGFTKLLGEIAVRQHRRGAIVRVAILHGYNDPRDKMTFTTKIVKTLQSGQKLVLDHGRVKYPTLIDSVALALFKIAEEDLCGVFHVAGQEAYTRYQWGKCVAKAFGLDEGLLSSDTGLERNVVPKRPKDVRLLNTRLPLALPTLDESLSKIRSQMNKDSFL